MDAVQELIDLINSGLASSTDSLNAVIEAAARTQIAPRDLERFQLAYQSARKPDRYHMDRVIAPDEVFEQCYAMMRAVLDESVVDPIDSLAKRFQGTQEQLTFVLMRRYWLTAGACHYDVEGQLRQFDYDPLCVAQHVVSVVLGDYISLAGVGRANEAIAGIGQLVTRAAMRRGQGHGSSLVRAFEDECQKIAAAKKQKLILFIVESEGEAQPFWAKMGYRWVVNSRYYQPPMEWDEGTGVPLFEEVPETLMIKVVEAPDSTTIDSKLLIDVVRALYQDWYIPPDLAEPAASKVHEFVFGNLFRQFEQSIAHDTAPLGLPPQNS